MAKVRIKKKYDELTKGVEAPVKFLRDKKGNKLYQTPKKIRKKYGDYIRKSFTDVRDSLKGRATLAAAIGQKPQVRPNVNEIKSGRLVQTGHGKNQTSNKSRPSLSDASFDLPATQQVGNKKNPIRLKGNRRAARLIKTGEKDKYPMAAVQGKVTAFDTRKAAGIETGMNPMRTAAFTDKLGRGIESATGRTTTFVVPSTKVNKKTGKTEPSGRGIVLIRDKARYLGTEDIKRIRSDYKDTKDIKTFEPSFYNQNSPSEKEIRSGLAKDKRKIRSKYQKLGRRDYSSSKDSQEISRFAKDLRRNTIPAEKTRREFEVSNNNPFIRSRLSARVNPLIRSRLSARVNNNYRSRPANYNSKRIFKLKEMYCTTTARDIVYLKESYDERDERNEYLKPSPSKEVVQRRNLAASIRGRSKLGNTKKVNESYSRLRYLRELAASSATMAQDPNKLKTNKNLYPENPGTTVPQMNQANSEQIGSQNSPFTNADEQRKIRKLDPQVNPRTM